MTRIVFLDRGTMGPLKQLVRPAFAHEWIEYDRTRPDEVVERLANCNIAISNKVPIRRDSIARLPYLEMIAIPATGIRCLRHRCLRRAWNRRVERSRLCGQYGPRTYICTYPRAAAFACRVPRGRNRGQMAGGRSILLLLPSDQRSLRRGARHLRRRRDRAARRETGRGVRDADAVWRSQGGIRARAALHTVRRSARHC